MISISTELLDQRLLKIHSLWKKPPFKGQKTFDGDRLVASSCFKAEGGLPLYQKWRFRDEYSLPAEDIDWWFIVEKNQEGNLFLYPFFDMLFENSLYVRLYPVLTSKIIVQFLASKFVDRTALVNFLCELDLNDFGEFIRESAEYEYTWKYIQTILTMFLETGKPLVQLTLESPLVVNNNQNELMDICQKVLTDNPKSVQDYKAGKTNSINHLKGQVMKATKGKANAVMVDEILKSLLS